MSGIMSTLMRLVRTPRSDVQLSPSERRPTPLRDETMVLVPDSDNTDDDRSLALFSDDDVSFIDSSLTTKTPHDRLQYASHSVNGKQNINILVPPPSPFADFRPMMSSPQQAKSIPTITTERNNTNSFIPGGVNMQLFRGPKNPLSAFYHHPLHWQNKTYISAEQAYQHEKFKHHKLSRIAHNELLRCHNSHDVKRISNKWLPVCNTSWNTVQFEVMEDICTAKLQQCRAFATALRESGNKILIHNTETDATWGCGVDFRGDNMMGKILMYVRKTDEDYRREFPPLTRHSTAVKHSHDYSEKPKKINSLVIGNSNARGLSKEINDRGLNSTGYVYPGQTLKQISDRIDSINVKETDSPLGAILIHAGDLEVRTLSTAITEISEDMDTVVTQLHSKFPTARIVISSIPYGLDTELNSRITLLKKKFEKLCSETSYVVYICNRKAKLQRDNVHLTAQSKDCIARTFTHHVKQCL